MAGKPPEIRDPAYPPVDSGILGEKPPPDNLSIVVGVGASLFDDRFGLADRKPKELVTMPFLANDRLDPKLSHGDLLDHPRGRPHRHHAVRAAAVDAPHPKRSGAAVDDRRLRPRHRSGPDLGRRDAAKPVGIQGRTANLDVDDGDLMDSHVWVRPDDGEPEWAVGGSYQAVRIIRMFVEFWDRTQLAEQETIIGRNKVSGAPLGHDGRVRRSRLRRGPRRQADQAGRPHPAGQPPHARDRGEPASCAAGSTTPAASTAPGRLDQGLAFIAYQRSLQKGFLAVQNRLKGEPLEEYILPVGGGFFFVLPGVTGADRFLGDQLVD